MATETPTTSILTTRIDPTSARFEANMRYMADLVSAVRNEEEQIREGGGLVVFHAANNAFLNWPEYNDMIGLGWREKTFGPGYIGFGSFDDMGKVDNIKIYSPKVTKKKTDFFKGAAGL